jgi:hypothetical protein
MATTTMLRDLGRVDEVCCPANQRGVKYAIPSLGSCETCGRASEAVADRVHVFV